MIKSDNNPQLVPETDHDKVEAELDRLLAEKRFSGAPQMSAFLRYIVSQTLDGCADRIKAYSVGVDALGKPPTFDAQNDPSVRVLALRLRKTLEAIYDSGRPSHAIIKLKVGTYVPEFYQTPVPVPQAGRSQEELHGSSATEAASAAPVVQHATRSAGQLSADSSEVTTPARAKDSALELPELSSRSTPTMLRGMSLSPVRPPLTVTQATATGSDKNPTGRLLAISIVILASLWLAASLQISRSDLGAISFASLEPFSSMVVPDIGSDNGPDIGPDISSDIRPAKTVNQRDAKRVRKPVLYLQNDEQNRFAGRIASLLGTSFFESNQVGVMRIDHPSNSQPLFDVDSYRVMVSQLEIDTRSRLEVLVIHAASGELVLASSVNLSAVRNNLLSEAELASIQALANNIVDEKGQVYQDYCQRSKTRSHSPTEVAPACHNS